MKSKSREEIILYALVGLILVLALALGFGYYKYREIEKSLGVALSEKEELQKSLEDKISENEYLSLKFNEEKGRNDEFANTIQGIASTVGTLDKLSKTDKELLQKYSKVYFLNEHYIPEALATVTPDFLYEKERKQYMHARVLPFFEDMVKDAKSDGVDLLIISAYRSFGEQGVLKNGYTFTYGTGANKFSADQGFSEHQLGTAFDFTTEKLGSNFISFEKDEAYKWLNLNAYKYGFVLSYPKGNSYYVFEPWHWRFVGKKLALRLHNEGESFYGVEQRIIDNYLINIFD